MTDRTVDSPSSVRSSSSCSSSSGSTRIKIKRSPSTTSNTNRRSQRRRMNVQPSMRSSSLATTIFHENNPVNQSTTDTNLEASSSAVSDDKLLFTTTSTPNSKSSFWTVTDRQPEWYKLSIPISQSVLNPKIESVPSRRVIRAANKKKSKRNNKDRIDQPTDTTQLIMKAVMHELDYDVDDDDLEFLYQLNQSAKKTQTHQLNEDEFENAIVILEYSTAEKIRTYLKQKCCEDDDIVCDICLLPDADDGNEMVFCERCNCCVHQNCYGIPVIPSGTWLCRPCSIVRRPACILCPKVGGPLKCTTSGTIWCHLTCALWIPELKFVDYTKMEPVLNLEKIPHSRWTLRCVVCSTSEGACVQCAHKNCRTPFHVTCGLAAGYFLDIQQTVSKQSDKSASQFNAYCAKHSDEARRHSEEGNASCLSSSIIPLTVFRRNELRTQQWINEWHRKFTTLISSTHLHEQCPQGYDENLSKKIYEYWINKRLFNKAMPLIKRINFVLEQRENSELLITQINNCLKTHQKINQLASRSQSICDAISPSSSKLNERFQAIQKFFSRQDPPSSSSSRHRSSSSESEHEMTKKKIKIVKRNHHKSSSVHLSQAKQLIETNKFCTVSLESTYRQNLKSNTTYVIGETPQGQMILLPKDLIEQANIMTMNDNDDDEDEQDEEEEKKIESSRQQGEVPLKKSAYTSQGNVVTCVTGSFN